MKLSINIFLLLLIIVTSNSCNTRKNDPRINRVNLKNERKLDYLNGANKSSIVQNENVYEIYQNFSLKNEESGIIGDINNLDLSLTSGAMISAYSMHKGEYSVFFRTKENGIWSDWIRLQEDKEADNNKRKVFSPKSLNNSVEQIQFKSDQITEDQVIFRVFTFKNK